MGLATDYLNNAKFEFNRYKSLGDQTFLQLAEKDFFWQASEYDNSIAIIIKHMAGNMLSRWTNFLSEDGEKPWRHRDQEFENPPKTKEELLHLWEKGWQCLFDALDTITESNFDHKVTIRGESHSIIEAINRQLAHYASHVGQLLLLGKMIKKQDWAPLSIPKGQSEKFNRQMFGKNS